VPLAGDFNGDGCATVSIHRPSEGRFFIINKLGANDGGLGASETDYLFGNPGDKAFVGDFDGDGVETAGLHRESTGLVYFRQTHTQGAADAQFIFGDPGDRLIAGDWNDNGADSPALFRPSRTTVYFRFTNTQGNADAQFVFGQPEWLPRGVAEKGRFAIRSNSRDPMNSPTGYKGFFECRVLSCKGNCGKATGCTTSGSSNQRLQQALQPRPGIVSAFCECGRIKDPVATLWSSYRGVWGTTMLPPPSGIALPVKLVRP
jgi:hypothetical protein